MRLPGIVISASTLSSRATQLYLQCKGCRSTKLVSVPGGMGDGGSKPLPRRCEAEAMPGTTKDCPLDPYVILHDRSKFVDQQTIKLQEAPDMVPVGELPRHMQLNADRFVPLPWTPEKNKKKEQENVLECGGAGREAEHRFLVLLESILSSPFLSRYLTGKVVPGSRVIATGIYSTYQSAKSVRSCPSYRKALKRSRPFCPPHPHTHTPLI